MPRSSRTRIRRKSARKTAPYNGRRTLRYSIASGLVITALTSIISVNLAALTLGFFGICIFALIEYRIRQKWEMAYDFKIKDVRDKTEALSEWVTQQEQDIQMLKRRVTGTSPLARPKPKTKPKPQAARPAAPATPAPARPPAPELSAAILRPARKPVKFKDLHKVPEAANQDKPSAPPPPAAQAHVDNPVFSPIIIEECLAEAARTGEIAIFMQPVVRLPGRQVRFYELFARLEVRPGLSIPAAQYGPLARERNLQRELDTLLLTRCLHMLESARKPERIPPLCLNIDPERLKDVRFMRRLLEFAARRRPLMNQLYFEMSYEAFVTLPPALLAVMKALGQAGCSFSLDRIEAVDEKTFDLPHLMEHKIRIVKIDHRLFMKRILDPQAFRTLMRIKDRLEGNGIGVVASGIERDIVLKHLEELNLHYGQGYLLGAPKAMDGIAEEQAA